MGTAVLMTHRDSVPTTEDDLATLPPPVARGPIHLPVPHTVLVQQLKATALARGYVPYHQELGLARSGQRLFGVMDLHRPEGQALREDRGFAIGFRNSTDETLGIRVVAGARVFVCDNLCLSGDMIALKRRNTRGLDLATALAEGFDRYELHAIALDTQIESLQNTPLSTFDAKARLFDIFAQRILPARFLRHVSKNYFAADETMTDCRPRTVWGLHNACTRVLTRLSRPRAFVANVALGEAFGLTK